MLWSGASGLGDGSSWADAFTTRAAVYAVAVAGDVIHTAADHAELSYGANFTLPNSSSLAPVEQVVVDRVTGDYVSQPVAATLDGGANFTITGFLELIGEHIRCGTVYLHDHVDLRDVRISNCVLIKLSNADNNDLINCQIDWKTVNGTYVTIQIEVAKWSLVGCSMTMGSLPAFGDSLFVGLSSVVDSAGVIVASDFSGLDATYSICAFQSTAGRFNQYRFERCTFAANQVLLLASSPAKGDRDLVEFLGCDFGAGYPESRRYTYRGDVITVADVVPDDAWVFEDISTTVLAQRLSAGDKCLPVAPLESVEMRAYVSLAGNVLVSVDVLEDYTAALTSGEVWLDVRVVQGVGALHADSVTGRVMANDAALTASAVAWLNAPVGSRSAQLSVAVTVDSPCLIVATVYLGRYEAGKSLWVNPKIRIAAN